MSTASQRRKAKRQALQAPFAEKVREVALSLPRRPPEPVNGMAYVDSIEQHPVLDGRSPRRVMYLPERGRHRSFVIPYCEPRDLSFGLGPEYAGMSGRQLVFTWRPYAVRAGDTEVRWFVPELMGPGATDDSARAFSSARKACALVCRLIGTLGWSSYETFLMEPMQQAREALLEFMGEMDPDSTRAAREARTNAEARAAHR